MSRHYLDHNATAPLRPESRQAVVQALEAVGGNPSSLHREGRAARALIEAARERVAGLVGARPGEVVFTSGGSEAINAALRGVLDRAPEERRRIVLGSTEHSAVRQAAALAARRGAVLVEVPCDGDGRIDAARFRMQLGEDVALACLQWANNETGVVQPVEELSRYCKERGVPFFSDGVQAVGKAPLDFRGSHLTALALSAHKIGGPQGVGALVVRRGIQLAPLVGGGAQEQRRRGGTEAVALIAGFGAAADRAQLDLEQEAPRLLRHRARLETRLREHFPDVRIHGEGAPRLSTTVNFAIPGVPGEMLAIALDLAGIAVSTGSACASGGVEPSHVLQAMGLSEAQARDAVRVSMGWSTEAADIEALLEALPESVRRIREQLAAST